MIILAITLILTGLIGFTIKRGRAALCVIALISIGASILMGSFVHHATKNPMTRVKIGGITRAVNGEACNGRL